MKSYDTFLSSSSLVIPLYAFDISLIINSPSLSRPAAALKTQPYDLLRWSAAYFRCLSLDVLPPVKPRYEHENVFGCLTKGYLKVLLSQVSRVWVDRRPFGSCHVVSQHFIAFIRFLQPFHPIMPFNCDSYASIYMQPHPFVPIYDSLSVRCQNNLDIAYFCVRRSAKDSSYDGTFWNIAGTDYVCLRYRSLTLVNCFH